MAASLSPVPAGDVAGGGRLRSNSAARPTSPDPASLTVRPIQTPSLPLQQLHHPQPAPAESATPGASANGGGSASAPLSSPRATDTPPPRPARAPLRSPASLPRSPSGTALGDGALRLFQKALDHSKDNGETLDLSRMRIERITDAEVEFLRTRAGKDNKGVWRLALSYNALYDGCIAASFASLNRLRYLNLKGNHLTVIPPALCEMQGLEILDVSKNQISALPDRPGRLESLKVLSLSNNSLTALPTYLANFTSLKVFKVDHNPIEWPPHEILGPLVDAEPRRDTGEKRGREEDLRPWIEGMKTWLREQMEPEMSATAPTDGDAAQAAAPTLEPALPVVPTTTAPATPAAPVAAGVPAVPGPGSSPESARPGREASWVPVHPEPHAQHDQVQSPRADDANASTLSLPAQTRHDRSISSSSLTPPISASTSSSHSAPPSAGLSLPPKPPPVPGHNRGGSYTVPHRLNALAAKKSLPDLRKSHAKIIEERRGERREYRSGERPLPQLPVAATTSASASASVSASASASTSTTSVATSASIPTSASASTSIPAQPRTLKPMASMELTEAAPPPTPSLDESRNSYFRRVSMLPPSTISKAVSPAMLLFIDAVRGLLFALTQLHTALREYVNFAVSDRVAGVFARVLEPAGRYLSNLINALDRFDSTSRRSSPPVAAVRGVVDAAKESIAVFGKIMAVLRFQTPAFKDADVRYTRQLLLSIYGGMAEVAQSWRTMAPLLSEIKPILRERERERERDRDRDRDRIESSRIDPRLESRLDSRLDRLGLALAPPMSKSMSGGRTPISPIPESGENPTPERGTRPLPGLTPGAMPPVGTSPRAKSRRHAGSFSTEDVERGMLMGYPVSTPRTDWPDLSRIFEHEAMADTAPPPFPLSSEPEPIKKEKEKERELPPIVTSFSQPPRSRHAAMSSTGSSFLYAPNGSRSLSVDIRPPTPASATLYDEDLLDQIETATDIAFTVWLRLSEDIGYDGYERKPFAELVRSLQRAEQVTTTLRESLMGLRANPFAYAHPSLPDNAAAFIKQVVKVLQQVKQISETHGFSTAVRHALSQLSQATRECAILIQVSSLQPTDGIVNGHGHAHGHSHGNSAHSGSQYGHGHANSHGHAHGNSHGTNGGNGAMSSNEELPGLRGLHLPRTRELRR